jgi:hypothetical protein
MRRPLHLFAAALLALMAVSHGLGTADAVQDIQASGIEPSLGRALAVLWVNGAVLPALLALVLLLVTLSPHGDARLAWLVAAVTAIQAVGAGYVAGPTFLGAWVIAAAALAIAVGLLSPGVDRRRSAPPSPPAPRE